MLVSLNWLKNYVDYGSLNPEELGERITKSGIEVDGIEYVVNEKSENIVVGYVEECGQHPNADKLSLCQVDVGDEKLQIICGAANVAQGQKVVVAKPGAVLPGNFKIKKVKLRGIESNGMICSLQELGVDEKFIAPDYVEGIVVLPDDAEIGQPVDDLLNLDDCILEFDLTPNRADALSMIGVAYEVAAILDIPINLPEVTVKESAEKSSDYISVAVEDVELCPYYGAFIIKDVEIKQSPIWMQNYLLAAGIRPINNVVDITNYVLLEYGQPLHAFDYDLLNSKEIVVRRAKKDEMLVTLDDKERVLSEDHLLITNGKEGIALAGVMGGTNTEVNDATKTILLEAAYFDPQTIRKAVQHTGLRSEASSRFEKGVDPNRVREAGLRACQLLQQYANGNVLSGIEEFDELDRSEKTITVHSNEINKRLGTEITNEEIEQILTKLRFTFARENDEFTIDVPTRRGDITIFEDIVEEVARIYGYDHLPYTLPSNPSKPGALTERQLLKRNIEKYLQSVGLSQAITYSLTHGDKVKQLLSPEIREKNYHPVALSMPMSEDHQYLRLSLLPELIGRLTYNVARKQANLALYEVGSIFLNEEEEIASQPEERLRLSGALTGTWHEHKWQQERKQVDFYLAKGIVEGLFNYLNVPVSFTQATIDDMHPGRCATMTVNDQTVGFIGQIHPNLAKEQDLKETYVFDLDLEYILSIARPELVYEPIPKYPSIMRDVAFVVKQDVLAGVIKDEIEKIGAPLVKRVEAFDVYTGENLEDDEKSIAYNLHYQDPEKTLTDKEVDASFKEIVEAVKDKFGAYVRE